MGIENPFAKPPALEKQRPYVGLPKNSIDSPLILEGRFGKIVCGTDAGLKMTNEDALAIDSERECYAAIDGLGGHNNAEAAARILSEELLTSFANISGPKKEDFIQAIRHRIFMMERRMRGAQAGGACFLAVRIVRGAIQYCQAGDVRLILMDRKKGKEFFYSDDEGGDEAVSNAITAHCGSSVSGFEFIRKPNRRFVIASDGLTKFFKNEEIVRLVVELPIEQAMDVLNNEWMSRMREQPTRADHRSIVMGDIDHV